MKKPKIESMVVADVVTLAFFMYSFVGLTSVTLGTLFFDTPLLTKFAYTTVYILTLVTMSVCATMILEARNSIKEINARNGWPNSI